MADAVLKKQRIADLRAFGMASHGEVRPIKVLPGSASEKLLLWDSKGISSRTSTDVSQDKGWLHCRVDRSRPGIVQMLASPMNARMQTTLSFTFSSRRSTCSTLSFRSQHSRSQHSLINRTSWSKSYVFMVSHKVQRSSGANQYKFNALYPTSTSSFHKLL